MRRFITGALCVAILGLTVSACTQTQGERCQRRDDCDGLVCVDSNGAVVEGGACTDVQQCGHCCPECTSTGSARWDVATSQCSCTSGPAPDGDGDIDGDIDADIDADADAEPDAEADADGPDAEG